MKTMMLVLMVLFFSSCQASFAPPIPNASFDDAFNEEGTHVAISIHHYNIHKPQGLASFPSGGIYKITDAFVDIVVVNIETGLIESKQRIDLSKTLLDPSTVDVWLSGLNGQDVFLKVSGCGKSANDLFKKCTPSNRQAVYFHNSNIYTPNQSSPIKKHKRTPDKYYLSFDKKEGVWLAQGGQKTRLLIRRDQMAP